MRILDEDDQRITAGVSSLQLIREAAKQIVGLTATLPALYFAAVSLSDVREVVPGPLALLFLLPPIPWLISQALVARIFLPRMLDPRLTPEEANAALRGWARSSQQALVWAYAGMIVGLALLLVAMGYYLIAATPPRHGP